MALGVKRLDSSYIYTFLQCKYKKDLIKTKKITISLLFFVYRINALKNPLSVDIERGFI